MASCVRSSSSKTATAMTIEWALMLTLVLTTVPAALATTSAANQAVADDHEAAAGGLSVGIESGFQTIYNNYRQCEGDADLLSCLKLKALKLVDRALSINNIPIAEGISLAKREDSQRSLNEQQWTATINNAIDENAALPQEHDERSEKLDELLWKRVRQFVESRSLQFKVNKLLFGRRGNGEHGNNDNDDDDYDYDYDEKANERGARSENANANAAVTATAAAAATAAGRGKKDKNKGMYMYMMMMKGGMMALAYKGLALLAGKALLVSKIALTLALLVAIKKLFSGGHHSQKTTYEIVKTPIITHSHQYSGGGNAQNAHYANDFTGYDGGPYARSLDEPHPIANQTPHPQRIVLKAVDATNADVADSRYTTSSTRIGFGSAQARSLTHSQDSLSSATEHTAQFNVPYAHLAAYRKQLIRNSGTGDRSDVPTTTTTTTTTTLKSLASQTNY